MIDFINKFQRPYNSITSMTWTFPQMYFLIAFLKVLVYQKISNNQPELL